MRSNCAHLSHFVQLLEQLNLADSLAKQLKTYTEANTTQFLSYTEPEKGTELSLRCNLANSQDGHSITASKSLSYFK